MAYIIDGAVILIFVLCLVIGTKRGFIKTMSKFVAFVVAAVLAGLLASPVAGFVFDSVLAPKVQSTIADGIASSTTSVASGIDEAVQGLPGFMQNLLNNNGITGQTMIDRVGGSAASATAQAESITTRVIRPLTLSLLQAVAFLLLFLVLMVVVLLVLKVLDKVFKLPGLKQLNKALGFVAGILSGILWVLLAVSLVQVFSATNAFGVFSPAVLGQTFVTKWVAGLNPLSGLLRDVIILASK